MAYLNFLNLDDFFFRSLVQVPITGACRLGDRCSRHNIIFWESCSCFWRQRDLKCQRKCIKNVKRLQSEGYFYCFWLYSRDLVTCELDRLNIICKWTLKSAMSAISFNQLYQIFSEPNRCINCVMWSCSCRATSASCFVCQSRHLDVCNPPNWLVVVSAPGFLSRSLA